ncbi:glycosyltransferase [Aquirhabdus sp.]|uniref:glycosyltransferase n=1 Tax=Aquirhabdus sp. TaxID=2824160 RepID=UPI00396CB0A2
MLSILITNIILSGRSGTEVATVELAYALKSKGHRVAIFSPMLGATARIARTLGIPVTNQIGKIGFVPDIIHGHHNVALIAALIRFPKTPAIFVCHDSVSPYDTPPPLLNRIGGYVAIDAVCRDRMIVDGVPESKIQIIANGVDLTKFPLRQKIAKKPSKALIVTKHIADFVPEIENACRLRGIEVDAVGSGVGKIATNLPERFLEADVVFAFSRSAIEASATGAMVILTDHNGFGGILSSELLQDWPDSFMGCRKVVEHTIRTESMLHALEQYDAKTIAEVSSTLRKKVGLDSVIQQWEVLYNDVIQAWKPELIDSSHDDALLAATVAEATMTLYETYDNSNAISRYDGADIRLATQVGKKSGTAIRTTGSQGFLVHGPYTPLEAGQYRVKLYGEIRSLGGEFHAFAQVTINKDRVVIIDSYPLIKVEDSNLILDMPLLLDEAISELEVRVWVYADSSLDMNLLEIIAVEVNG